MADNRIIIGKQTPQKDRIDDLKLPKKDELYVPESGPENKEKGSTGVPEDDNLWGNDWQLNKHIDSDYLAEKRLFVRIRYFQPLECRMFCPHADAEPENLDRVQKLTMFDLSIGGIGAISDSPIPVEKILVFSLPLDHAIYDIRCQVVYCVPVDNVFRLGFRILTKERDFIRHLKLYIARLSLMGSKITFKEILDKYSDNK